MAVFDTGRLRDILVRGNIAKDPEATEFVEELNAQTESVLAEFGSLGRMELMEARILVAIAEAEQRRTEMEARMAELAASQSRQIKQAVGILLASLALAVGIVLGFG
jgi:hypothetical protein